MKITGRQLRMARVAMKWRVDDLSKKCGVPWARLQLFERSDEFIEESEALGIILADSWVGP